MMRRIVLAVLLAVVGIGAFFILHHPPMRLMPAPLLFRQAGAEAVLGVLPRSPEDSRLSVFYATNRLPVGPQDQRVYTVAPGRTVYLGEATLRIGGEDTTLDQLRDWSFTIDVGERPFIHLERMRQTATLPSADEPGADAAAWLDEIDAALAASRSRDILVYVHGANTTVERAAGQAAQLRHFAGRETVVVLYVWPTAENFLRYPRDIETAFGAAPHLAELLALLARETEARSIGVFTYSAGATIGSAALATFARDHPDAAGRLGEIYHAAPDADFAAFVDDLALYAGKARRVTAAVNLDDSALRLAQAVNRTSRAGRPDLADLDAEATDWLLGAAAEQTLEIVSVDPDTMPDLPPRSHTFWYDDPWVSNDVLLTLLFGLTPRERELAAAESVRGVRYWTFPADYPERIPAVVDVLRPRLAAAP